MARLSERRERGTKRDARRKRTEQTVADQGNDLYYDHTQLHAESLMERFEAGITRAPVERHRHVMQALPRPEHAGPALSSVQLVVFDWRPTTSHLRVPVFVPPRCVCSVRARFFSRTDTSCMNIRTLYVYRRIFIATYLRIASDHDLSICVTCNRANGRTRAFVTSHRGAI